MSVESFDSTGCIACMLRCASGGGKVKAKVEGTLDVPFWISVFLFQFSWCSLWRCSGFCGSSCQVGCPDVGLPDFFMVHHTSTRTEVELAE